jgi:hypothetical protein
MLKVKRIGSVIALICALLSGCVTDNDTTVHEHCQEQNNNQHILVFIDKSSSSVFTDEHRYDFLMSFQYLLKQLVSQGDRVKGYFIHENTLGAKTFIYETFTVKCPDNVILEGESRLIREGKIEKYKKQISTFQKQIQQQLSDAISEKNVASTRRETDLWAALYHMDEFFAEANQGDAKTVVFISDMAESVAGRSRRDFSHRPPRDIAQAGEWAAEDIEVIKQMYKKDFSSLADVTIHIGAPIDDYEANNYEFIRVYWKELFEQMGIHSENVKFDFGERK